MVQMTSSVASRQKETGVAKPAAPSMPRIWQSLESLRSEVDHLFDDYAGGLSRLPFGMHSRLESFWKRGGTLLQPAVELVEKEKAYEITAELPGLKDKDVEVSFDDNMIVIRAEKKEEREETKNEYYVAERRYGSIRRCFTMPDDVDQDKVEATMNDGVLSIVLPKSESARRKVRKIAVKGG